MDDSVAFGNRHVRIEKKDIIVHIFTNHTNATAGN